MKSRLPALALGAALLVGAAEAQLSTDNLLARSPFMPAGGPPAAAAAATPSGFELRGFISEDGAPRFAILNTASKRAFWVGLNQTEGGVRVTGYDPAANAISIEAGGQPQRLVMKPAEILAVAATAPQPQPAAVRPDAPTEQQMQERRTRIIEELRRRRTARQGPPPQGGPQQ